MNVRPQVSSVLASWRRAPVSAGLATIIVATSLGAGQPLHPLPLEWRRLVADGAPALRADRWWTPLTSIAFAPNLLGALVMALLLLSAGVVVERRLGSLRHAAIGVGAQVAGSILAAWWALPARWLDPAWGRTLARDLHVGCEPFLAATAMAATARMDTLWRRRTRLFLGLTLVLLAAFGGSQRDLATGAAGLLGLAAGACMRVRGPERSTLGTRPERRRLVGVAVAGFVVASLASTLAANPVGPLASMRLLFRDLPYDAAQLAQICADPTLARECRRGTYLLRNVGVLPALTGAAPLVLLLVLSRGLANGRRLAWRLGVGVLATYLALWTLRLAQLAQAAREHRGTGTIPGFDPRAFPSPRYVLPVLLLAGLLVLLLLARRTFDIRLDRALVRRAWARWGLVTLASAALPVSLGMLWSNEFAPVATPVGLVGDFLLRLVPTGSLGVIDPPLFALTSRAAATVEGAPAIPWLWGAGELWFLLGRHTAEAGTARRERMVHLLRTVGGSTLSWWSTWADGNRWWFSDDLDAGLAYRPVGGVAVTPCAPACRAEDLPRVVEEFAQWCSSKGLVPALYSVHSDVTDVTDAMGWAKVEVAEETLLRPQTLEFKGKKFQDVRTAINRAEREGIRVVRGTWAELPPRLRTQVASISEGWVADKGLPEMGFTLGGLDELDDPAVVLFLAADADDVLHGLTSWLPVYRDDRLVGITLDFMRRAGGFKMSMELLIAHAVMWAKEEGLEVVSLSGAPLARVDTSRRADQAWARTLDAGLQRMGAALEPAYGFRSLLAFKAKFQPEYRPMYLTLPEISQLPAVGRALAGAYLPELDLRTGVRISRTLLHGHGAHAADKPAEAPKDATKA